MNERKEVANEREEREQFVATLLEKAKTYLLQFQKVELQTKKK